MIYSTVKKQDLKEHLDPEELQKELETEAAGRYEVGISSELDRDPNTKEIRGVEAVSYTIRLPINSELKAELVQKAVEDIIKRHEVTPDKTLAAKVAESSREEREEKQFLKRLRQEFRKLEKRVDALEIASSSPAEKPAVGRKTKT